MNIELRKESVQRITAEFLQFASCLNEQHSIARVNTLWHQYQLGLFRLVVVGEVKKGKSSFINALLGSHSLLPTLSDVATSTVFKVIFGEKPKYKVFFYPQDPGGSGGPKPLEISQEQLAEYGTEDGNPRNVKMVDFIGVEFPHPLLKSGVVIIDTPGLGGLCLEHAQITWRYIPNADAVFFVLDSLESVLSKEEMEYIQKISQLTPYLFFVQTKTDLVDIEQWQQWRNRNLRIISEYLRIPQEKIVYFPVSSELKKFADQDLSIQDLQESGFGSLLDFLHHSLLKSKEEKLAMLFLKRLASETRLIQTRQLNELRIINTDTKEGLEALEREYHKTQAEYSNWRNTEYPKIMKNFYDRFADLKRTIDYKLQNELDPSPQCHIISTIMGRLKAKGLSAKQLTEQAGIIQNECIDMCMSKTAEIKNNFIKAAEALVRETTQQLGKVCSVDCWYNSSEGTFSTIQKLDMPHSLLENLRQSYFGGVALVSIISLLLPGLGLGPAIMILLGGGLLAHRDFMKRKENEAIAKIQGILQDTTRLILKQANQQFQETAIRFERAARQSFEEAAQEIAEDIQSRLDLILETQKRSREENKAKAEQVKTYLAKTEKLLQHIDYLSNSKAVPF